MQPSLQPPSPAQPFVPPHVTKAALFLGFLKIGLIGFGGVGPWARRVIVEERGWMAEADYAAVLGFGQILPGANTINAAVIIGDRFQGAPGAAIAVLALLSAPMAVLIAAAALYDRFGSLPDVRGALSGVAVGAAGLVIGTGLKMAQKLKPDAIALVVGGCALVAVAAFRAPLLATVLALAPIGVGLSFVRRAPR
jgi:chromate transporter